MAAILPTRRLKLIGTFFIITVGILILWLRRNEFGGNPSPEMPVKSAPRPKVSLRQGTVVGIEVKGSFPQRLEEFLGIPYALPTDSERRFRPPVRLNASAVEIDGGGYGHRCPAGTGGSYGEDCLNVNIFRWKIRGPEKKLPVLVYVHGGAFNSGAGNAREISSLVAWSAEPFIGVSFNYRTGAFGFLSSKLAAKEGILNVGLKDQHLLFEWVRDNIAEFGGNPDNVTLMGSSAGAHSIGHHLFRNNATHPLFHKVIIESGASTARACYTHSNPLHEDQFAEFLEYLGLEDVPSEQVIRTLQTYSMEEIKSASDYIFNKYDPSVRWPYQPVIDGEGGMIPVRPIDAWRAAQWHKIPILTGFNTNEGAMFVPEHLYSNQQFNDFFHTLLPSLTENDLEELNNVYLDPLTHADSEYREIRMGLGAQFKRLEQAYGHFAYVAPVRHTALFAAAAEAPVYLYHFAASSSIKGGADHGTHYQFPTYSERVRGVSDTVDQIAGTMHAYWASFITTGDPNALKGRYPNRPEWPRYGSWKGELAVFGEGNDEVAGGDQKGVVVSVRSDAWPVEESEYWWKRVEKFEV